LAVSFISNEEGQSEMIWRPLRFATILVGNAPPVWSGKTGGSIAWDPEIFVCRATDGVAIAPDTMPSPRQRTLMQMSVGNQPQDAILRSIELLGTIVAPKVRAELLKRKVSA
jgi:hypothetical protein